jgi:TatA/E family protein of Tat protein translocase
MFGSLGMSEILLILVIALIVFGPRKLPQLGRSLGESLAQFRRASEDFKRSWEQEITVEEKRLGAAPPSSTSSSSAPEPIRESQPEPATESQPEPARESKS